MAEGVLELLQSASIIPSIEESLEIIFLPLAPQQLTDTTQTYCATILNVIDPSSAARLLSLSALRLPA